MSDVEHEQLLRNQIDQMLRRLHARGEYPAEERELVLELCRSLHQSQSERHTKTLREMVKKLDASAEGGAK